MFGDRTSGAYLHRFGWTKIVRHYPVKGAASPDDPTLGEYWAQRRRTAPPLPVSATSLRLLKEQAGRCTVCGSALLPVDDQPQDPREWEGWLATIKRTILTIGARTNGPSDPADLRLIHAHCRDRHHGHGNRTATPHTHDPSGLA